MSIGTRPFSNEEITSMLKVLPRERDKILFMLGLKTGFRISELLSIKVADLIEYDAIRTSITISKSKMKGKVASRCIPINCEARNALKIYIEGLPTNQKYLFTSEKGNRLSRTQAWRIVKAAARQLELTGKIATHSWRKTFAIKVYEKLDKDLAKTQKAMGHANINSTVHYLSVNQEEIDNAILEM